MNYIELQICPICGAYPEKDVCDLGRPGGRGYPGSHTYQYKCERCGLVKGRETSDIYVYKEVTQNNAKQFWNDECDRIKKLMEAKREN